MRFTMIYKVYDSTNNVSDDSRFTSVDDAVSYVKAHADYYGGNRIEIYHYDSSYDVVVDVVMDM